MPSQSEALRLLLAAIRAMHQPGYTDEDIADLTGEALTHQQGGGHQPYVFGHCTNRRRLIIGWLAYHRLSNIFGYSRYSQVSSMRSASW